MAAEDGQWRYIAQRVDGITGGLGAFLDFNVPLKGANLEEVLSGHNSLTGTINPEYPQLIGVDGLPLFVEWGTAIWAESPDGEIRGGGVLTHSQFTAGVWDVECTDLTGTTIDLPYTEASHWVNIDPIDVFRYIWRYIQSQPNGNIGVSMDPTTSPVRIGSTLVQRVDFDTEPDPTEGGDEEGAEPVPVPVEPNRYANNASWRAAAVRAMRSGGWNEQKVDDALGHWLNKDALVAAGKWKPLSDNERQIKSRAIEKAGPPPNPPNDYYIQPAPYVATPPPPVGGVDPTPVEIEPGPAWDIEPFTLAWYKDHNLAGTIDDLATSTPFDWHMTHRWIDDEIRHHIRIGYPRLGRRRSDLRFVVGENIHIVPTVERDGTEYANEVLVLGAGEGAAMKKGRAFRRVDGRLRKVQVISDPSLTTDALCISRAELELAKRFNLDDVTEIMLMNHPHAPLGSVDIGDEILIEGETGWVDLEMWVRVITRRMSPEDSDSMGLTVIRSDRLS